MIRERKMDMKYLYIYLTLLTPETKNGRYICCSENSQNWVHFIYLYSDHLKNSKNIVAFLLDPYKLN